MEELKKKEGEERKKKEAEKLEELKKKEAEENARKKEVERKRKEADELEELKKKEAEKKECETEARESEKKAEEANECHRLFQLERAAKEEKQLIAKEEEKAERQRERESRKEAERLELEAAEGPEKEVLLLKLANDKTERKRERSASRHAREALMAAEREAAEKKEKELLHEKYKFIREHEKALRVIEREERRKKEQLELERAEGLEEREEIEKQHEEDRLDRRWETKLRREREQMEDDGFTEYEIHKKQTEDAAHRAKVIDAAIPVITAAVVAKYVHKSGEASSGDKPKTHKRGKGPALPYSSLLRKFREDSVYRKSSADPKLPPTLFALVTERMDKSKIQELAEIYIESKSDTHKTKTIKTVPVPNAVYVFHREGAKSKDEYNKNLNEMRGSDSSYWLDNTQGSYNEHFGKGEVIQHHVGYLQTGKTVKKIKCQDSTRQKHIFTLADPYNMQIVHYLGENLPTGGDNEFHFRMIPGAPGEPNTFEVTATAREPPADSADGHAHGTVSPVRHSPSPPRGDAIMPSEEETDDGISTVRRYRLPKDGDETVVEFALPRYSHPVKLTDFEADKIIDAYSRGLGKLLNTEDQCITRPGAGDIYVFDTYGMSDLWHKTILKDTLMWGGDNKVDSTEFALTKNLQSVKAVDPATKKKVCTPKFQRAVFHDGSQRRIAVIQYIGDNATAVNAPHGNSRTDKARPFIATSEQVKFNIRDLGLKDTPDVVWRTDQARLKPGLARSIGNMRDTKSIAYEQSKLKKNVKLTTDKMANIWAVSNHLPGCVREICVKSQTADIMDKFTAVVVCPEQIVNVQDMLRQMDPDKPVVASMDTTFNNGVTYQTTFSIRNPVVERRKLAHHQTNPEANMMVGHFFHERKRKEDHQHFITEIHRAVDESLPADCTYKLARKKILFITDDEFSDVDYLFRNTYDGVPREVLPIPCWSHLQDNVKRKLKDLHMPEEDVQKGLTQFKNLMKSDNPEEFGERRWNMFNQDGSPWANPEAEDYFVDHVNDRAHKYGATFRLREFGLPNPEHGITSNAAESINAILKRNNEHKQLPIAENMLNMYFATRSQAAEISSAYYNLGEYHLAEDYKYLEQSPDSAPPQQYETVQEMKEYLHQALTIDHGELGRGSGEDTDEEEAEKDKPTDHPTVAKIAKLIWEHGDVEFSKDERGLVLVKNVDANKQYRVNVPLRECECGNQNCAHLRVALYQLNFTDGFGTPPKVKQTGPRKPSFRRPRGSKSGSKTPRKKDTADPKAKKKSSVDDFLIAKRKDRKTSKGITRQIYIFGFFPAKTKV